MAALPTCHVVAATILLDCRVALGALLCVRRNPVGRLGVILTLLEPPPDQRAWCGLMVVECASKAEMVSAVAVHGGNDLEEVTLLDSAVDGIDAVGSRTPLEVLLVIHICSSEELLISMTD